MYPLSIDPSSTRPSWPLLPAGFEHRDPSVIVSDFAALIVRVITNITMIGEITSFFIFCVDTFLSQHNVHLVQLLASMFGKKERDLCELFEVSELEPIL
jgi:hypothetical protein